MRSKAVVALLLLSILCLSGVSCEKVLFLIPFPGSSHWLMFKHFIRELTERGHEVTAVTSYKFGEAIDNYTEVLIDPSYPILEKFPISAVYSSQDYQNDFKNLLLYWRLGLETSRYALESANVQKFIKREDQHFDLIVAEQFFQESLLMFAHKFDAPIITISTIGYSDYMDRAMGLLTPWSFVPHMLLDCDDQMSFYQRAYNVLLSTVDYIGRELYYLPQQNKLAMEIFDRFVDHHGPLPTVQSLEKSISAMLVNSHQTLAKPRPSMVGIANIAGAHIKPPKPLPQDLQKFMDEAEHGVIYFSLGAYLQSSLMPLEKRSILLNVFAKLQQRVIWKYESGDLTDVPDNVLIRRWAPQNDILAHKNVILFISHGGLFGTFESMHHGVPTLFIPFFADQPRNAARGVRSGYARKLSFKDITEDSLFENIREMVQNKEYSTRAQEISVIFRDRLVDPMNESIFWMEYVMRNKGARHLKSQAVNLSLVQYLLLDIVASVLVAGVVFEMVLKVCCLCRKQKDTRYKKKQN
ncbi:UDP-glucuronosyltransferase 2B7 [Aedes aegypti]|uniref:UDP-glucuronosyltransferase n=1 Tax=Aedes aegypti TaxID=7159 RepID=A0A1S4EZV6_AEDAE|nr:UDP-glucuronosyltransferase 2B7 [Aedes aegypti]